MPGRDEIRELILGAAEGATGGAEALGRSGVSAAVEDFDVEVNLTPQSQDSPGPNVVIRFSIIVSPMRAARRSAA